MKVLLAALVFLVFIGLGVAANYSLSSAAASYGTTTDLQFILGIVPGFLLGMVGGWAAAMVLIHY